MATDWTPIRKLVNSAIDAREAGDVLNLTDSDRMLRTGRMGVTVFDVLTSAWTYPENLQYAVIRARHQLRDDAPFRPEFARVLREVGGLCGELVGASQLNEPIRVGAEAEHRTIRELVETLANWYETQMTAQLRAAAEGRGD